MIYIHHRINTREQLKQVPKNNGIEMDIRYHENELILQHDPFSHHQNHCEKLVDVLAEWQHRGPLILNIKCEGIEEKCINLMNQYQIQHWFFLDISMPFFVRYANQAKKYEIPGFTPENLAVRYSEYEPIEYALSFAGKAKWLWLDCFTHMPLNQKIYLQIKDAGFQICLVSPELQNHPPTQIADYKKKFATLKIDAVCSKYPELWQG